jgi:hypothetical protein
MAVLAAAVVLACFVPGMEREAKRLPTALPMKD